MRDSKIRRQNTASTIFRLKRYFGYITLSESVRRRSDHAVLLADIRRKGKMLTRMRCSLVLSVAFIHYLLCIYQNILKIERRKDFFELTGSKVIHCLKKQRVYAENNRVVQWYAP